MELLNALYKYDQEVENKNIPYFEEVLADLLRLWLLCTSFYRRNVEKLGYEYSVFNQKWPVWDESALIRDSIELAIQINGKVKGQD